MEVKYVPNQSRTSCFGVGPRLSALLSVLALVISVTALCLLVLRMQYKQQPDLGDLADRLERQQALIHALQQEQEEEEEEKDESNPCLQEKDPGPCMAAMPRWFFDHDQGRCDQFVYGGCSGNGNNFITLHDCSKQCEGEGFPTDETACSLAPSAGPCRDQLPRFYHDPSNGGSCKKFLYGGCAGNSNNFVTEEECLSQCTQERVRQMQEEEVKKDRVFCHLAVEIGDGDCGFQETVIERWFFDGDVCRAFAWRSCGAGNGNNFASREKCETACSESVSDTCALPAETGPCKLDLQKYFYNQETATCEIFIYGGCEGNDNNFFSKEDCEKRCVA